MDHSIHAELLTYYQQGVNAGLIGKTSDDCPFKRSDRKGAWIRGLHYGLQNNKANYLTENQAEKNKVHIANIKEIHFKQSKK